MAWTLRVILEMVAFFLLVRHNAYRDNLERARERVKVTTVIAVALLLMIVIVESVRPGSLVAVLVAVTAVSAYFVIVWKSEMSVEDRQAFLEAAMGRKKFSPTEV